MSIGKVIAAGKVVFRIGEKAANYLGEEARNYYALLEPVEIRVRGKGAGGVNWSNSIFEISSIDPDFVTFRVQPFEASTHYWNGPSVIHDYDDGRIEASLVHDLIWEWAPEIAKANGLSEGALRTWSNRHLAVIWCAYAKRLGKDTTAQRVKAWIASNVCNSFLSRLWRKLTLLAILVSIAGCSSCIEIPDWEVDGNPVEYVTPDGAGGDNG